MYWKCQSVKSGVKDPVSYTGVTKHLTTEMPQKKGLLKLILFFVSINLKFK